MWAQLPRAATNCEVHEQNQHELRQLNRTGLRELASTWLLPFWIFRWTPKDWFSPFGIVGGHQGCSYAVPMVPWLHYQVSAARAPPPHAPQGQHEAVSAPGGLHLLEQVENWELDVEELAFGGASSSDLKLATPHPVAPASFRHLPGCLFPSARALTHPPCHYLFTWSNTSCCVSGADSSDFPLFWFKSDTIGDWLKAKTEINRFSTNSLISFSCDILDGFGCLYPEISFDNGCQMVC